MTQYTLADFRNGDSFDSRDVIERIAEIEAELGDYDKPLSGDEVWEAATMSDLEAELATLKAFADDASDSVSDWPYGETFIRDSYFKEYAQELADDIGAIDSDAKWPLCCIDWDQAARELRMDYTSFELDGVTFWARS